MREFPRFTRLLRVYHVNLRANYLLPRVHDCLSFTLIIQTPSLFHLHFYLYQKFSEKPLEREEGEARRSSLKSSFPVAVPFHLRYDSNLLPYILW